MLVKEKLETPFVVSSIVTWWEITQGFTQGIADCIDQGKEAIEAVGSELLVTSLVYNPFLYLMRPRPVKDAKRVPVFAQPDMGICNLCGDRVCEEIPPEGINRGKLRVKFPWASIIWTGKSIEGCSTKPLLLARIAAS